MPIAQINRPINVKTPLGDDVLVLSAMSGTEELGRLFKFELNLLSEDNNIKLEDILGQNLTVSLAVKDGNKRYFNGIVNRFCQVGQIGGLAHYQATLRPWFWLLTRKTDCRIFQNKTVPDIIKEVFQDNGFSDFELSLSNEYREWENCVQYRETDFNFISRLMEQEGIYYFFIHEDGKHTLRLADFISAHEAIENPDIPYYPHSDNQNTDVDYISDWCITQNLQPGAYMYRDFDFKKPKANLETKVINPNQHDYAEYEIYDYPGEYVTTEEGNNYVASRLEELHVNYEQKQGITNVRTLYSGGLFKLLNFSREDQNREYMVVSASYQLQSGEFAGNTGATQGDIYSCNFNAINSDTSYRTTRSTPKPVVQGAQTAIVVGPSGEEIWTDKYGRIKVQFHWDRYGENNENSSCWIRVSHPWAGKNWGAVVIPRMGQEVIVSFIEGDPDRPIVTGRVYNDDNMPPYELPANATQSGVKTRSSKSGTPENFNEIRFEDKKGSEEVYVHAEKDQNNIVENNETTDVGNNRTETVGNDETITIGNNRTESVGVDETITIGSNRSVTIGANKTETISINKAETIGVAKELTIGGAYQVTVGGIMNETVALAKAQEVGATKATVVAGNVSEKYGSNQSTEVSKDHTESVGKNQSIKVGENQEIKVGKKLTIDVGDQIVIKTGKASITMKKDGTIQIEGKDISIKGSGKVDVKASKNITMKGQKILQN